MGSIFKVIHASEHAKMVRECSALRSWQVQSARQLIAQGCKHCPNNEDCLACLR